MATSSTIRQIPEREAAAWELYTPPETEEQRQKREALRQELLAEARESVARVEAGQKKKWTGEETLQLFARLRAEVAEKNPERDLLEEFLAERRAEAERE